MSNSEAIMVLFGTSFCAAAYIFCVGLRYFKDESNGTNGERKIVFVCYIVASLAPIAGAVYLLESGVFQ
jgi:hypothetical protein